MKTKQQKETHLVINAIAWIITTMIFAAIIAALAGVGYTMVKLAGWVIDAVPLITWHGVKMTLFSIVAIAIAGILLYLMGRSDEYR